MPEEKYLLLSNGEEYEPPEKPQVPNFAGNQANHDIQQGDYKAAQEAYHEQNELNDRKIDEQSVIDVVISSLSQPRSSLLPQSTADTAAASHRDRQQQQQQPLAYSFE
jgi:hypothetical protein